MFPRPLFAFWQFASGWMLLWGIAASIPIIIHLWSKRRYREESWAAMEFLMAALRNNARRIRIEQLILLIIRTAILVFLAISLADPLFSFVSSLAAGLGGGQTHWVLVIDGSYSMNYRNGEAPRFELARELAKRVVKESTQGDGFTLVLMSDRPQVVISNPAFDPGDLADEIESLRLRHGGANLASALSAIETLLEEAKQKHPRLTRRQICFFTDLGQTTWEDSGSETCRRQLGALQEEASLLLYDVGSEVSSNLAVTDLSLRESIVTARRDVLIEAEIKSFGSLPQQAREVRFRVDGKLAASRPLSIAAGGQATVSLTHRFESPGEHTIEARLDDDSLLVDNHRWLSVPVKEMIRVLCIRGKPEAARHVAMALNPAKSDEQRVQVSIEPESAILESDLRRYACIFLCNVGRLGEDEARLLRRFVVAGGGLVVCLGDQVQADNYNALLAGEQPEQQLLPARLGELASHANYSFDPLEYRHPIVAPFRGFERSGLLTTPVWRYIRLQPVETLPARTVLAFNDGDPAIMETTVGRGRCLLVATALSQASFDRTQSPPEPWTAIATWPSFPPLVQEILEFATSGLKQTRNVEVGQPIGNTAPNNAVSASLTVFGPQSPNQLGDRVSLSKRGNQLDWTYDQTWWSGIYDARFGPPVSSSQLFSANLDTRESSLARWDAELLPSQIQQATKGRTPSTALIPTTRQSQYFRFFLGTMLALLFLETLFAWRIGRDGR